MSKREKGLFLVFGCVLILLYLMSSTNLIIKEKKTMVYPISIIIEDSNDDYYLNYKKGMEQAAREYHVDTRFITLYEGNDEEQQMELVKREMEDGAKAVIMAPVMTSRLLSGLESLKAVTPVVLLGTKSSNDWISANITMDYEEAGRKLGKAFVKTNDPKIPVYLFTDGLEYGSTEFFYQGLISVLEPAGFHTILYKNDSEDALRRVVESTVYPFHGRASVIALDTQSLTETAAIIEKSSVYNSSIVSLYGIGSTQPILNNLDRGVISGVVAANDFNAGYLSIQLAVEAIEKGSSTEQVVLESFYIDKESLKSKQYEKMLYPME